VNAQGALAGLWQLAQLPPDALRFANLTGHDPVFPSSFAVGAAAQSAVGAAALAACELAHVRGADRQRVSVDMTHAAIESTAWFSVDDATPELWDPFSGLYRCEDGWVRIHANFRHHRDGALNVLGLDPATATREAAEEALMSWKAVEFETAMANANLVATALRTFDEWDATGQAHAIRSLPLFTITRIGDAAPLDLPRLPNERMPLDGVRVIELTRILAGPVGGRTLAAYGADVMLVNSPHLPNIDAVADTSRGKRSSHIDLRTADGREAMDALVDGAHVFIQGYRPGGLQALGYGPDDVARARPGIVYVSLSAYGSQGPWAARRGFDSLVQTATGFNHAEGEAAGEGKPRALPMQILDEATGFLIAMTASAALRRQQLEGGSWHVQLSLAQTGQWLRSLGRIEDGFRAEKPDRERFIETSASGFGELRGVRHAAVLERTPARYSRPSMPPGSHPPRWG
jgi:crotonobetainyl-CoA:carnitine CoA-transferase CaiB-like acyl-CoA transferase